MISCLEVAAMSNCYSNIKGPIVLAINKQILGGHRPTDHSEKHSIWHGIRVSKCELLG